MSKTASGAANVGSSFENTTAMIATMVEATRESPENIGSALKSIISRFGEMKKGSAFDEDGELIDVNKVQTALASVGVSLLDAQGQFRDFDDVIFELADKWDTLDKNSQRYVATIAAGNRQQSRFIALVSNGKRLREVATAAEDSEDAGLIQYSKTLDSLESKQANLKTSFQQFYMGALNGDFFKGLIDSVNAVLEGFNKLSKPTAIMNIAGIISALKMLANLGISLFSNAFGQVRMNFKSMMEDFSTTGRTTGEKIARNMQEGFKEESERIKAEQTATGTENVIPGQQPKPTDIQPQQQQTWAQSHRGLLMAGTIIGGGLSAAGSVVAQKDQRVGSILSGVGNAASAFTNVSILTSSLASAIPALAGLAGAVPVIGAVAAALVGLVSIITSWPSDLELAQEKAQKAAEEYEDANLQRAEDKQKVSTLSEGISKLKELSKSQYDSEDAKKEWLEANNSLFESLPELTASFDSAGNAIIDLTSAEEALAIARRQSAQSTIEAAEKELEKTKTDLEVLQQEKEKAIQKFLPGTKEGEQTKGTSLGASTYIAEKIASAAGYSDVKAFMTEKGYKYEPWTNDGKQYKNYNLTDRQRGIFSLLDLSDEANIQWVAKHFGDSEAELVSAFFDYLTNNPDVKFNSSPDAQKKQEKINEYLGDVNTKQKELDAQTAAVKAAQTKLFSAKISSKVTDEIILGEQANAERYAAGKAYNELDNADTLITDIIKKWVGDTPLDEVTDQTLSDLFNEANTGMQALYERLAKNGSITDFNELTQMAQEGKLTEQQYTDELTKIFGVSRDQFENIYGLNIFSDAYYKKIQESQEATYEALINQYRDQEGNLIALDKTEGMGETFDQLSKLIPETYSEGIIKYAKTLQAQVEAGTITSDFRNDLLQSQYDLWSMAATITDSAIQGQVRQILGEAEFDSTMGKIDAAEKLRDIGQLDIADAVMAIDTGTENLITAFDSLSDKMASSLDKMGDAITDAADGLSLEDAIKAAKKANLNLDTDFQLIDGKFFVNSDIALQRINESQTKTTMQALGQLRAKNAEEQEIFSDWINQFAGKTQAQRFALEYHPEAWSGNDERIARYEQLKKTYQTAALQWKDDLTNRSQLQQLTDTEQEIFNAAESMGNSAEAWILLYLRSLDAGLVSAGEKYLNHKLAEQQATNIDNLIKNISTSLGGLTDSIEGTLSAADLLELQDRYGLTGYQALSTPKGYSLGKKDQETLTAFLYRNAYDSFGRLGTGEFGKQLWEAWQDAEEPLFKSYQEVEEAAKAAELAAKDIGERTDEAAKSAWDYADALRAAASAAMLSEDAYEFTFMEQDATKGLTKNFDSFVSQINTVQEAFKSLKAQGKDGYIGYQDFYNMMDFLQNSIESYAGGKLPASLEHLNALFTKNDKTYEDFVNSVVANTDKWGKVNIEGIAAQMGISVEAAMSAISEGMSDGLKDVARQQIKYLSGLEQMLKALDALNSIGDVSLKLDFQFSTGNGDEKVEATLSNFVDLWNQFSHLPDNVKKQGELEGKVKLKLEQLGKEGYNDFTKFLGLGEDFSKAFFGENGFNFIDAGEAALAQAFGRFSEVLPNLTEGQAMTVAESLRSQIGQYLVFDEKSGEFAGFAEGAQAEIAKILTSFISEQDWSNVPETIGAALSSNLALAAAQQGIPVEFSGADKFTIKTEDGKLTDELKQQLINLYESQGFTDVDFTVDSEGNVTVNYHIKSIKTYLENNPEFQQKVGKGNEDIFTREVTLPPIEGQAEVTANIDVNAKTGTFTYSGDASQFFKDGKFQQSDFAKFTEDSLGITNAGNFNYTLPDINGKTTITFSQIVTTDENVDPLLTSVQNIESSLSNGIKITVDDSDALTKINGIAAALAELQNNAKIEIQTSVSGEVLAPENLQTTTIPEKTGASLVPRAVIASAGMSDISQPQTVPVTIEADTSSAEQEIQQSLSSTPIDVPVEIAQADNDAAYQFISSYENIITQVLNASSDAQLNLSQMFNFGNIDTSGLQQVSVSINEIAASLQKLSGSHTSIDQIGQSAQQAESKVDGLVGELQALAGRLKEISGSVSFDLDTDGISLLSNALVSLNEQGTSTITFSANGDEVKKVAEAVKGYIASVDTSHSTTFRASTGNVKSVVNQVQKLIASIKTNIPINFSGTVRISKTKSDATTAVTDGGQRTATTKFTGNVNGKALVNGQTYGAAVAGKTLVGELGPELAVYDNKYHLLGEDGAEFVNLPSDAIVFNHLQTQGIIDGKVDKIRGTQLNAAYQHATMYTGNALVEGNAFAGGSGIGAALAAVRRAKSVWQGLLNSLSAADLMNGGGGGGGGGGGKNASLKPYIADLQEWYNLSRQIVDLENRINTLVAQRNNLSKGFDQGAAYLRNLKESQALLEDQLNTQRDLYRYQQDELKRQADAINDSSNWISKFYKVGADGVLQYVEGNETNGGKGALEVLQELNDMGDNPERYTIKDQVAWIEKVTNGQFKRGFTWEEGQTEDENGKTVGNGEYTKKEWTDEEYVQEFFSALQEPIDDYDGLRDSVQETEEKLESLAEEIQKVNDEIRDNEIEVSQMIYDAIVQVKEKVIKDLKESNKLITDANKAYADSIQNAITKEKNQYSINQNISERETLQRQLSLLRRSGGSASEIQSLEKTISEKLKDEYFQKQEDALEVIKDANTKQTELMEQQVQLLQDTLDYEKENGVLWTKVYEIMDQGNAFMLDFLSGAGADSFLEKANLEQKKMLEEWAFKIGLYSENERSTMLSNKYAEPAFETLKNNISDTSKWKEGYKDVYDSVDAATRTGWDRDYLDTYNSYMLKNVNGQSSNEQIAAAQKEASRLAEQTFFEHIAQEKKRREDNEKAKNQASGSGGSGGSGGSSGGGSSSTKKTSTTRYYWENSVTGESGYASSKSAAEGKVQESYNKWAKNAGGTLAHSYSKSTINSKIAEDKKKVKRSRKAGGSATNTGLYMLHGTQENPEYILNASQTRGLEQLVSFTQKNPDFVNVLKAHYDSFAGNLASQNYTTSNSNSINISDGAIQISVAKLNDSYDIEDISNDIMDRMYSIAAKSSSRSVSRR